MCFQDGFHGILNYQILSITLEGFISLKVMKMPCLVAQFVVENGVVHVYIGKFQAYRACGVRRSAVERSRRRLRHAKSIGVSLISATSSPDTKNTTKRDNRPLQRWRYAPPDPTTPLHALVVALPSFSPVTFRLPLVDASSLFQRASPVVDSLRGRIRRGSCWWKWICVVEVAT